MLAIYTNNKESANSFNIAKTSCIRYQGEL